MARYRSSFFCLNRTFWDVLDCCSRPILGSILLLVAVALQAVSASSEEEIFSAIKQKHRNTQYQVNFPEIVDRIDIGDFSAAESLATTEIEKKASGQNPQREAYLKAEAHMLRARARLNMDNKAVLAVADFVEASQFGYLIAIRALVKDFSLLMLSGVPDDIIAIGVDLGDPTSLSLAAKGFSFERFSGDQRLFFELLLNTGSHNSQIIEKIERVKHETDISRLLQDNAFVGGPIFSDSEGRPGRDVLATLYAESIFRDTLAYELSFAMNPNSEEKAPSARDLIERDRMATDYTGMASSYILVPENVALGAQTLVMPLAELARAIGPGDQIYVNCGPLAHTTTVFSVDPMHDEIVMMDSFFQYWQPSHNPCIRTFSQKHWRYGYYHTHLKLTEVLKTLVALRSFRSYEPPAFVDEIGGSASDTQKALNVIGRKNQNLRLKVESDSAQLVGSLLEEVLKDDLFTLFNFEEVAKRPLGDEISTRLFLPRDLRFRNQVVLALRTVADEHVRSASIFLRQSSLQNKDQELFSTASLVGFGFMAFGQGGFQTYAAEGRRESGQTVSDLIHEMEAVLAGERKSLTRKVHALDTYIGNVIADTGVRWIRVDVW